MNPKIDIISIGYVDNVVHLVAAKYPDTTKKGLAAQGEQSLEWGAKFGALFDQKKGTIPMADQESLSNRDLPIWRPGASTTESSEVARCIG